MEKEGLQTLAHLLTCPVRSRASWEGEAGGEGRTADTRTPVNIAQLEVARLGKERQVEKEGLQTLAHLSLGFSTLSSSSVDEVQVSGARRIHVVLQFSIVTFSHLSHLSLVTANLLGASSN